MTYYTHLRDSRGESLSVTFDDGATVQVPADHVNFGEILGYIQDTSLEELDQGYIVRMADLAISAGERLTYISERVRLQGNRLLFDGDVIDNTLSEHIVRLLREDADEVTWRSLVNFLEKVSTNPSKQSVDAIYTWIRGRNLTITSSGDIIAYKGVAIREDGTSVSISHGTAIVNGQVVTGAIPNVPGSIIEMPRSQVDADNAVGCSTGLHAGTWGYASSFSRARVLTVKINPRDIVSVPDDSQFQKLRVSRYEVIAEIDQEFSGALWNDSDTEEDDDDEYLDYDDYFDDDDVDDDEAEEKDLEYGYRIRW